MEKYNYYSEVFKKAVLGVVLAGRVWNDEARRNYGIKGKSTILNLIRKFDPWQDNKEINHLQFITKLVFCLLPDSY